MSSRELVHGKENTYKRHNCRCGECVEAFRAAGRRRRALAKARPTPDDAHGRVSGYTYWGCRCGLCTAAYTNAHGKSMKEYRERNRDQLRAKSRRYYHEVYKPRLKAQEEARRARLLSRGA